MNDIKSQILLHNNTIKIYQYYIKISKITGFIATEEVKLQDGSISYLFCIFFDGNKIEFHNNDKNKSLEMSNRFMEVYFESLENKNKEKPIPPKGRIYTEGGTNKNFEIN